MERARVGRTRESERKSREAGMMKTDKISPEAWEAADEK